MCISQSVDIAADRWRTTHEKVLVETRDEAQVLVGAPVRRTAVRRVAEVNEHFLHLADGCTYPQQQQSACLAP